MALNRNLQKGAHVVVWDVSGFIINGAVSISNEHGLTVWDDTEESEDRNLFYLPWSSIVRVHIESPRPEPEEKVSRAWVQ